MGEKNPKKYANDLRPAVITVNDDSSTSSNEVQIIEAPVFAKKITNDEDKKVHDGTFISMHNRVVSRARSSLTKKIKESIDSSSTGDEDESIRVKNNARKNDIRKLKQIIQLLESSTLDNSNINAIKSVTNDGKDLVDSYDAIKKATSEEVPQRLEVYHEIE